MSDLTIRGWFKTVVSDLTDGAFALVRMTKQRGLHINLRNDAGTEIGTVTNPLVTSGGGGSGSNAAAGLTGAAVPTSADYVGFNVGGNLVGVSGANPLPVSASVSFTDPAEGVPGAAAPAQAIQIGGTDGTNLRAAHVSAAGAVTVDGSGATQPISGSVTAVQATGTNLHVVVDSAPTTAVTNAGLTNLDVALSTRTKPADQQHAIIDSGTTTVTQATGTNLHVVVDSAPSTTVSGTVAVSNTSFAATGSATPADATALPTTAQLHEAYAMLYNGVSFDMQRGTSVHGALVTDPAIWTLIGLTRLMLTEMRALRLNFSAVSGMYVEDDSLETTVQ